MSKVKDLIAAAEAVLAQAGELRSAEERKAQLTAEIAGLEDRRAVLAKEIDAAEVELTAARDAAGKILGDASMERNDIARETAKIRAEHERERAIARRDTDVQVAIIRNEVVAVENVLAATKEKHSTLVGQISEIRKRLVG
jgi:chromosome segregation ATPase